MAQVIEVNNRIEGEGLPMDLTREEYVHCQMLLSRVSGPLRTRHISLILSLVMAVMLVGGELVLYLSEQSVDWLLLGGGVLLVVLALLIWFLAPVMVRRGAEKAYDRTVACGIGHYGLVRVYPDRIEKQKATITATVPITRGTLFMEDAQMQVFVDQRRQAIILPARCLTPQMAEDVRQAAQCLAGQSYRFFGRVQPLGQCVTPPPETITRTVLLETTVQYTTEEYIAVTKDMTVQMFWKRAPWLCTISVMGGVVFGWTGESILPCVIWFLVFAGLLTFLNLVAPLRRVTPTVEAMSAADLSIDMCLDEKGLRIGKTGYAELGLPWEDIRHVYDKGDMVEICGKEQFFRIPKRHIPDIDAFSADIDRYLHHKTV